MTLEDLLTEDGLAPFLAAHAAKTCWHFPAERPAAMQRLLPWDTIETLIAHSLVPGDRMRILVDGAELPRTAYCEPPGKLLPDVIQDLAAQGATLVIDAIDALVPAISQLAATLERRLHAKVGVNCYLTFGAGSAFPPHSDGHDVLVLQMYGVKRWRRYGIPFPHPIRGTRPSVDAPLWEGNMVPGDLLFLPRGEVHAATPVDRPSVHLTISLLEPTGVDFVQWLAGKARDIEALRRGLGPTLTGETRAARHAAMREALRALVDQATVEAFLADADRERAPRPLAPLGRLGESAVRLQPATGLRSALRRRIDLMLAQEGEALLTLGTRRIRLSHAARRTLGEIDRQQSATVATLAAALACDVADPNLIAILGELVRKSLIAVADNGVEGSAAISTSVDTASPVK